MSGLLRTQETMADSDYNQATFQQQGLVLYSSWVVLSPQAQSLILKLILAEEEAYEEAHKQGRGGR